MKKIITVIAILSLYVWPALMWILMIIHRKEISWTLPLFIVTIIITGACWAAATGIWYYMTLLKPKSKTETSRDHYHQDFVLIAFVLLSLYSCNSKHNHNYGVVLNNHLVGDSAHIRDYCIDVHFDTIFLWDKNRLVGRVINKWDSPLDSLIAYDNQ